MNSFKYSFEEFQGIQTGKRKSSPVDYTPFLRKSLKKVKQNSPTNLGLTFLSQQTRPKLSMNQWEEYECGGEGDCFFRVIAFLLGKDQDTYHSTLRKQAIDHIKQNTNLYINYHAMMDGISFQQRIEGMSQCGTYAEEIEIQALARVLLRRIVIFEADFLIQEYIQTSEYGTDYESWESGLKVLYLRDELHYNALIKKSSNESTSTTQDLPDGLTSNQDFEDKEESKNDQGDQSKEGLEDIYVRFDKQVDRYNEVWVFLKFGKYPERFSKYEKTKLSKKKYEFKCGLDKFLIDETNDRLLEEKEMLFHHLPKHQEKPQLNMESKKYSAKFWVPYKSELEDILQKAHNVLHCGRDRMREEIHRMGFAWNGINESIRDFIKRCNSCKEVKLLPKTKRKPKKQMISSYPLERFQIDCLGIYEEIGKKTNFKKLICVVDHFSKYHFVRPSVDGSSKEVEIALRQCFRQMGIPDILQSDNGKEFDNKRIKALLLEKDIEFIHGRPYHPESQGAIERCHRTLQDSLKKQFIENKKEFCLEIALEKFTEAYNSREHSTTKMSPNEAIKLDPKKKEDKIFIDYIILNTKSSRKGKATELEGKYSVGERLLLYSELIKSKTSGVLEECRNKITKKTIKGYLIPATIVGIGRNLLEVRIDRYCKINNAELLANEVYHIEEYFVLEVEEEVWLARVQD